MRENDGTLTCDGCDHNTNTKETRDWVTLTAGVEGFQRTEPVHVCQGCAHKVWGHTLSDAAAQRIAHAFRYVIGQDGGKFKNLPDGHPTDAEKAAANG